MLNQKTIAAAKEHARQEFPMESCGLVVAGKYLPMQNVAADPLQNFEIAATAWVKHAGKIQAVLHSHPNGPLFPSQLDMEQQIATAVPWGIIALDEERVGEPVMWGDSLPIPNVIGRGFMHGVTDCYSIIRDCYRLGRDGLAKQGVEDWPFDPILLPEVPRNDNWWASDDDLYSAHFAKFGFKPVDVSEARPGDVFLKKIYSQKFNHGGVLLDGGLILHHLANRLSRREPAGIWGRAADLWIRYAP